MNSYIVSIIINIILGIFSQYPILYGLVAINGGISMFGPPPEPSTKELVIGWSILLSIVTIVLVLNILLYKKLNKKCKSPKILFIIGILSFIAGLFSFTIGIFPPDIFDIM